MNQSTLNQSNQRPYQKNRIFNLLFHFSLLLISVIFLLFFSVNTTPITINKNGSGGDSAFFMLVGQGMLKGKLPYVDFFDMKGPSNVSDK